MSARSLFVFAIRASRPGVVSDSRLVGTISDMSEAGDDSGDGAGLPEGWSAQASGLVGAVIADAAVIAGAVVLPGARFMRVAAGVRVFFRLGGGSSATPSAAVDLGRGLSVFSAMVERMGGKRVALVA